PLDCWPKIKRYFRQTRRPPKRELTWPWRSSVNGMKTSDIIKASKRTRFVLYREGTLIDETDTGFQFPVPIEDVGKASMLAEDKTIYFMRWIRKQLEHANAA